MGKTRAACVKGSGQSCLAGQVVPRTFRAAPATSARVLRFFAGRAATHGGAAWRQTRSDGVRALLTRCQKAWGPETTASAPASPGAAPWAATHLGARLWQLGHFAGGQAAQLCGRGAG